MMKFIRKLKPAVPRSWLFLVAGAMWTAVGLMLLWRALGWLQDLDLALEATLGLLGIGLAFLVYRFGFTHTAQTNIARLCRLPDSVCVFAFNSWKSYLIIVVMATLGIALRQSPLPRTYLAVIYTTIGGALFLASMHFYQRLWLVAYRKQPCLAEETATRGRGDAERGDAGTRGHGEGLDHEGAKGAEGAKDAG
ncbi:MAG: hypothetical protein U9R25_16715, partial [Chloroflexota bacterium]|nr:hypothetical protein [Chloroflexota bacterium]